MTVIVPHLLVAKSFQIVTLTGLIARITRIALVLLRALLRDLARAARALPEHSPAGAGAAEVHRWPQLNSVPEGPLA